MSASPAVKKRKIYPQRDAWLAGLITFTTSIIGLAIIYYMAADAQLQAVRSELLQIARTGAAQVNGDLHDQLRSPQKEGSPEHELTLAPLVRLHRAAHDLIYVYTAIRQDGQIYWVLDTGRHYKAPGNEAPPDPLMTPYRGQDPELQRAFEDQRAYVNEQPVKERMRTYLSAYAPFFNSRGEFAGLLCVDMVLSDLEQRMAPLRTAFAIALVVVLILSAFAGWVALRIRQFTAALVGKLRTARAEAEESASRAEAASRAKAAFLAMMSHEIRTPMNGMLGVADLLHQMNTDPEQKKLLHILSSSGDSLLRIINDILDFSKIEAERLELKPRPFELRGLLEELAALLQAQARGKPLSIVVDVDPRIPPAFLGDRQRLSQVLLNLGNNAVKFTDRGEVRLEVALADSTATTRSLEFTVRDSGPGMGEAELSRLFVPFTQLGQAGLTAGGTGLGLVISQKLVRLMGGEIRVKSAPGQGAAFSFCAELPVTDLVSASGTHPQLRLSGLSVLVAEDNAVNQTVISAMLRQLGHGVSLVSNGREALNALAQYDYDLVLMDFHMPVMDGLEATRLLRAGAAGVRDPRVPVIALTANAMDSDRDACLAAGMNHFLPKPVSLAALREAIHRGYAPESVPALRAAS